MPALSFTPLTFNAARAAVLREVRAGMAMAAVESVELSACDGRVLAEDILADRDYPPFRRSMRDGFAVRASDTPGRLRLIGEVRAGQTFSGTLRAGETVEIMTGAPVPGGADAVVMVEHCIRHEDGTVSTDRSASADANISPRGCEASAGSVVLTRGGRLDYAAVAGLASLGRVSARVFVRPRVAILSTGDELVDVGDAPASDQIRNSNAWSLAAQVRRAGGVPVVLPVARDTKEHTRSLIEQGLGADLLLISGGVSTGKYDVVEPVLAEMSATFFFDRVLIQPGQPLVFGRVSGEAFGRVSGDAFGRARDRFFFGLPGNPASTMVTFEIFARAAMDLLSGATDASLPLALGRLACPLRHRPGLTRFLPARVCDAEVTPVAWKGSGDIPSLCRANAWLVADAEKAEYASGDPIYFLFK